MQFDAIRHPTYGLTNEKAARQQGGLLFKGE